MAECKPSHDSEGGNWPSVRTLPPGRLSLLSLCLKLNGLSALCVLKGWTVPTETCAGKPREPPVKSILALELKQRRGVNLLSDLKGVTGPLFTPCLTEMGEPSAETLGTDRLPMKWGIWSSAHPFPLYHSLATAAELRLLADVLVRK